MDLEIIQDTRYCIAYPRSEVQYSNHLQCRKDTGFTSIIDDFIHLWHLICDEHMNGYR